MKNFRQWGIAGVVALGLLVSSSPAVAKRAATFSRPLVHKLASNNGIFEAGNNPEWVLNTGSRVIPYETVDDAVRHGGVSARAVTSLGVKANRILTIVPVQWAGATWTSADRAVANGIVNQLVPWWHAMSANQETLTVRFASTVDVSSANGPGQCDVYAIADKAIAQVKAANLFTTSDHVMMTFTGNNKDCSFGGLGEVGGALTWTYAAEGYMGVWAHELGHNMGFPHGNTCNAGVTLTYLKPCTEVEYGDVNGTMGMGGPSGYYAPTFLAQNGWLPDVNRSTWSGVAQTYSLNRPDRTDLGITAINIPSFDPAAGDNSFWLQYNPNKLSYVTDATASEKGGVAILFEPSAEFSAHLISSGGVIGAGTSSSYLCDITTNASDLASIDFATDPRLQPLRSWTDPRNKFRVTVASVNGTTAEVRIEPLGQVLVTEPTNIGVVPDETGAPHLDISWGIPADAYGANEPSKWYVEVLEDSTKSCSVQVWESTCHVDNVVRGINYTPGVSGVNGVNTSNRITTAAAQVSTGPPAFFTRFENTSDEIKVVVHVDNGGAAIIGTPTIEIAGQPPCAVSATVDTTCTFSGLLRKSLHTLIAKGTNSLGARETKFTSRTLAGIPDNPSLSARWDGKDLMATVSASTNDQNNVDVFEVYCVANGQGKSTYGFGEGTSPNSKTFRVPNIRGKDNYCYGRVMSTGTVKIYSSGFGLLRVSKSGKITPGRLVVKPVVKSTKKGSITVSWKTSDSLGKVAEVVTKASVGKCKKLSATSCVVSGLQSGATVMVVVSARGTSGSTTVRTMVVVK